MMTFWKVAKPNGRKWLLMFGVSHPKKVFSKIGNDQNHKEIIPNTCTFYKQSQLRLHESNLIAADSCIEQIFGKSPDILCMHIWTASKTH